MVQYKFHGMSISMPLKPTPVIYNNSSVPNTTNNTTTNNNTTVVPTIAIPTGAPDFFRARIDKYFSLRGLKFECGGVIKNISEDKPIIFGSDVVNNKDAYTMENNYTFGSTYLKNSIVSKTSISYNQKVLDNINEREDNTNNYIENIKNNNTNEDFINEELDEELEIQRINLQNNNSEVIESQLEEVRKNIENQLNIGQTTTTTSTTVNENKFEQAAENLSDIRLKEYKYY